MNRRSASLHIQDSRIVPAYKVIPQRLMSFLMGKERSKRFQHIGTWSPLFLGGVMCLFHFFLPLLGDLMLTSPIQARPCIQKAHLKLPQANGLT